jgi:hypothetical protein
MAFVQLRNRDIQLDWSRVIKRQRNRACVVIPRQHFESRCLRKTAGNQEAPN